MIKLIGLQVLGKGGKVRIVKISRDLWAVIQAYRFSIGKPVDLDAEDTEPLFVNRYGNRLSTVSLRTIIKDGARSAGIKKDISPHWLRHTHGTLAIIGGATLNQVRDALGHSDIRTTQRYEHSAQALADTAADHVGIEV